jgi:hypothetical protein
MRKRGQASLSKDARENTAACVVPNRLMGHIWDGRAAPEGGGSCVWRPATDMSMQGVQRKFTTEVVTSGVQESTGIDPPRNKVKGGQQEGNHRWVTNQRQACTA